MEKDLGSIVTIRSEAGYIQKGFKNKEELRLASGFTAGYNENVILHNFALNLGAKICPIENTFSPYLFLGTRLEYLLSYKDIIYEEAGSDLEINIYDYQIKDFEKFNYGALIGIGVDINELLYLEIEFNPNISPNYSDNSLTIRDFC